MRDNGFARAQTFYEAQQPPEYDIPTCPECDGEIEENQCVVCGWLAPEPDYEREDNCD